MLLMALPWLLFLPSLAYSQIWAFDSANSKELSGHLPNEIVAQLESSGISKCLTSHRKSPINIDLGNVTLSSYKPLQFENYEARENVTESEKSNLTATIHGYENWKNRPTLTGGPLKGEYKLHEVHWEMMDLYGPNDMGIHYGHTIGNAKFDFELHFVHTLNGLPLEQAALLPQGVVIIATFVNEQAMTSDYLQKLNEERANSTATGNRNEMFMIPNTTGTPFEWVPPDQFFPDQRDVYFMYNGTFSHPPCEGEITWIIMANAIPLNKLEMTKYLHAFNNRTDIALLVSLSRNLRDSNIEVFFNLPAKNTTVKEALPLKTTSNDHREVLGGIAAAFLAILAVVLIVASVYRYIGKRQKRFDTHFNVGFDNINFINQNVVETSS